MSTPTVRQIREGVATLLDGITGLRAYSTIPGQFSPPAAIVGMPSVDFDAAHQRGLDEWSVTVWVLVAHQSDRHAETSLEKYLNPSGATSVKATIEADGTLGGVVSDTVVTRADPTTFSYTDDGPTFLGVEFELRVLAEGA